jgi:hypothetical protein
LPAGDTITSGIIRAPQHMTLKVRNWFTTIIQN